MGVLEGGDEGGEFTGGEMGFEDGASTFRRTSERREVRSSTDREERRRSNAAWKRQVDRRLPCFLASLL
jgi:hypothetical protein